jgi:glyoxylase-like metal-dependent hydrolase (beta-lactamase superfamily II)
MRMRKETALRITVVTLALAGLWLAWSQNPPATLTMQKVTDSLYVIIGDGGNVAVMPTPEGVIVVDDKFAQDAPQIMAKIKTTSDKPVRYVINTHQHGDHTGGNEAMLAANAEILIHNNARANMVAGKQPGLPRITFTDETHVFLGGKEVVARYLGRGHTNGDAVVYFPSERVLHTGDLFVTGTLFCDTANGGSIKEWDTTVKKMLAMDFDTVIPGHGELSKRADLVKWSGTVATVRGQVQKACAGGAAGAIQRLDLTPAGMKPSPLFERGLPGMCQDLAQ